MTIDPNSILSTRNLIEVGIQADDVRRRMHGTRTTFVRVFAVDIDDPALAAQEDVHVGEFRIVGRPPSETAAVTVARMVADAARAFPRQERAAPLTGFSLSDLRAMAPEGEAFSAFCARLREAGLEAIAEVPLDLVEESGESVRLAREAGLAAWRLTVRALPKEEAGAPDPRITIVEKARDLQNAVGGFRAFAPLPRTMSVSTPTTGYDDVKLIALARLIVSNIESIQVDWPLYGPKLAQVALTMGADDVDGIAAVDPGLLGTRRSAIEEIRGNIRAASLEPVERDGRFQLSSEPAR